MASLDPNVRVNKGFQCIVLCIFNLCILSPCSDGRTAVSHGIAGGNTMNTLSKNSTTVSPVGNPGYLPSSAGGLKAASELKKGSVMDILGKSSNSLSSSGGLTPAAELKKGSVMDILGKSGLSSSSGKTDDTETTAATSSVTSQQVSININL